MQPKPYVWFGYWELDGDYDIIGDNEDIDFYKTTVSQTNDKNLIDI